MNFRRPLVGAVVALLATIAQAQVPAPWLGTWKLRVAAGAPPGSEVVRFEPVDGGYRSIHDSVGPDGKVSHYEYFARPDGKDYPSQAGSPMSVRVIKVDDHTIDWWTLKDGAVVVSGRSVHSRDGKTKTMTFTRTNEKGEKVEVTKIYDRVPDDGSRSSGRELPSTAGEGGIASVTEGSGLPLLVVHGAWGDYRSFSLAAPVLATQSTVTRVSLRLHWPNPWPATEQEAYDSYRIERHAADLVTLIEKSGRFPVDLLGHSYGGVVVVAVARSRPDLVRRLILVEPAVYWLLRDRSEAEEVLAEGREWRDKMLARIRAGEDPVAVTRGMYDDQRPGTFDSFPEWRRQILVDNARTMGPVLTRGAGDYPFTCPYAAAMRMPVLIVVGARTSAAMRQIASRLFECLPDSRRAVLPDATHVIQFDAPETMARVVADYLAR